MPGAGFDSPVSAGALPDRARRTRVRRAPGVAAQRQGAVGRVPRRRVSRLDGDAARVRAAPARRTGARRVDAGAARGLVELGRTSRESLRRNLLAGAACGSERTRPAPLIRQARLTRPSCANTSPDPATTPRTAPRRGAE